MATSPPPSKRPDDDDDSLLQAKVHGAMVPRDFSVRLGVIHVCTKFHAPR